MRRQWNWKGMIKSFVWQCWVLVSFPLLFLSFRGPVLIPSGNLIILLSFFLSFFIIIVYYYLLLFLIVGMHFPKKYLKLPWKLSTDMLDKKYPVSFLLPFHLFSPLFSFFSSFFSFLFVLLFFDVAIGKKGDRMGQR